jgi:hypothetical protein
MEQADESLPELLELNYFSFSLMKNKREFSLHV